jgi:hypothetical protein
LKVKGNLAENSSARVAGIIPSLTPGKWKAIVKTQFTGSENTSLKTPRVIESSFTFTVI